MRTEKTKIEIELEEYYYAAKDLKQLSIDLESAERKYKDKYDGLLRGYDYASVKSSGRHVTDPTQLAAILIVDNYRADVEKIKDRMIKDRCTIDRLERMISGLDGREREYVKLRHFELKSFERVCSEMHCEASTVSRTRLSALDKLERGTNTRAAYIQ